ncbi:SDR family NAD(P)-dependent oxidoreductase [Streptomyces sp. NPDC096132]|uniref:SDR family NAD(P)-dependent oxidoreductase n=1 Tax=Streptomyces sp. NPDC096132 TaxID=3366075 RepID=UPI0038140C5D
MSKVIAVLGAGTGLGVSLAHRFGREGFRVALVARRTDRLEALVAELADKGVEAAAFPADLSDPAQVPALVGAIRARFGRIDVVEYGPISTAVSFTPATQLDAATLEKLTRLLLLTPVEVFRTVLPELTERGDGALLLTLGASAAHPYPHMSGPGPAMAGARNYLHTLHAELDGTGVYAGTLVIGAMIARSEGADAFGIPRDGATAGTVELPGGLKVDVVDPDDLAEYYWDMYTRRDRVEQLHPAPTAPDTDTTA